MRVYLDAVTQDLWAVSPTWRDTLARLRADLVRYVPPAQVLHNGNWWTCGPVSPPDATTRMHVACWYAVSPAGHARGLSISERMAPRVGSAFGAFSSLRVALGLTGDAVEAIFGTDPIRVWRTAAGDPFYQDPGGGEGAAGLAQVLGRIDALLAQCRVLSSR
jgi:hypothetical protein